MGDSQPKTTRRAPTVKTEHTARRMKSYMVYEWELRHAATLDGWTTLFSSLSSAFASLFLGLWTDLFVEGSPSEIASQYGMVLQWTFAAIAALFGLLAWRAYSRRQSELDGIKHSVIEE
jgi:hypothetical protein